MIPDNLICGFRAGDGFFLNIVQSFFAPFYGCSEPFAGFHDFFFRDVSCGGKQRLRVFQEMFANYFSLVRFVSCVMRFHIVFRFYLVVFYAMADCGLHWMIPV